MRCTPLLMAMAILSSQFASAVEECDYWAQIKQIHGRNKREDNPELLAYLRSLTKDQMLIALRQFGKEIEAEEPVASWSLATFGAAGILMFYPEPMRRSDFSDEEFRGMREGAKRKLEAGLMPKTLTDEALEKLVAGIANRKEGAFFRFALAGYLDGNVSPGPETLSQPQRERLFRTYLSVLADREAPLVVRRQCCESAWRAIQLHHRKTVYGDAAVQKVLRGVPLASRPDIDALIVSGGVAISAKTREQLASCAEMMRSFRTTLAEVAEDDREPASLRDRARTLQGWIDRHPLVTLKETERQKK